MIDIKNNFVDNSFKFEFIYKFEPSKLV